MFQRRVPRVFVFAAAFTFIGLFLLAPSPTQSQDDDPVITFTPYPENPVFVRGLDEEWAGACGTMFAPQVIQAEGMFYMFYTGSCERLGRPAAIGYAQSPDGIQWTPSQNNPILEPDGNGYDAMCVSIGVPVYENGQWILYYAGNSTPCAGPGQHIGRAVAESPDGEWIRDEEPLLEAGQAGDWDEGFIMPHAVIHTEDQGYVMFYSGGSEFLLPLPRLVGIATSPDGIHWTKYNDLQTNEPAYANSDPILEMGDDGTFHAFSAWSLDVAYEDGEWEMIFSNPCPQNLADNCPTFMGYGVSEDGIHWQTYRTPETAVLTRDRVNAAWASHCICHPSFLQVDGEYRLYFVGCTDEMNDCQIGLATGTITR